MSHERYYLEDRLRVPFAGSLRLENLVDDSELNSHEADQVILYTDHIFPIETGEPLQATGIPQEKPVGY